MTHGVSLSVEIQQGTAYRANARVTASAFEGGYLGGITNIGSDLSLDGSRVTGVQAQASDGAFGDGLDVVVSSTPATATITGSRVEGSARAGIASFGAPVSVAATALSCNMVDLDGETYRNTDAAFDDGGGNTCGCDNNVIACEVLSSGLMPPSQVP